MHITRDPQKNEIIKKDPDRFGISFEDVENEFIEDRIVSFVPHTNQLLYPWQYVIVVIFKWYYFNVPCKFIDTSTLRLITIYPSRKSKKFYS